MKAFEEGMKGWPVGLAVCSVWVMVIALIISLIIGGIEIGKCIKRDGVRNLWEEVWCGEDGCNEEAN